MSTDPQSTSSPTAPGVVAVVTAEDPDHLRPCLEAIADQVYGPSRVIVVGGSDEVRHAATEAGATWRPHMKAVYDSVPAAVDYIWALRERARPRPEALAALVADGARVDASVAGSKVVDASDPRLLISVGYSTDVFDAPYSGLQPGEQDQAQYDVIRDVAAVSDTSMLIRRDLFRGLGGIDLLMSPTSAAVDFCQRARLRGGRVVVVPSSVVGYQGPDPAPRWRERAGETRAMIKAYSPLTLLWAIPVAFLVGLAESVLGLVVGRFALPGLLAAGFWNLFHLPSALRARFQARRGREAGDEELFRYQVNGSARLRHLWDEVAEKVRSRFPEGVLSGFAEAVEAGQQRIRNPAFFAGLVVVGYALVATRQIWGDGLPMGAFSLLPPEGALDALDAYAGGWNPAGFGSPEVLHPSVAATAVVQLLLFGRGGAAVAAITVAAAIGGVFGLSRLLVHRGVDSAVGLFAGLTLMAGVAVGAMMAETHWSVLPAVALLPWAVAAAFGDIGPEGRLPRLALITLLVGAAAAFSPASLPVALLVVVAAALVGVPRSRPALWRVLASTVAAVPLLMPWILYSRPVEFLRSGEPAFWAPSWLVVALIAVIAVGVIGTGDRQLGALTLWGGFLGLIGAAAARSGDLGGGSQMLVLGGTTAGLGLAIMVGAALEAGRRRRAWGGSASLGAAAAWSAAVLLVLGTVTVAGPGRAGLPPDTLDGIYRFADTQDAAPSRILLFGPAESIPGDERDFDGLGYRVFVPPYPRTWEALLNTPRMGDDAFHEALGSIVEGGERRAGELLARFGIGWVVFAEPSPLQAFFDTQLDIVPLRSLDFPVYRNEVKAALAVSRDGSAWWQQGTGFVAPDGASGEVVVAVNGDWRWGPGDWQQEGWANRLSGNPGRVEFAGHLPRRLQAIGAAVWLTLLGLAVLFGVRRGGAEGERR